MLSGRCCDSYIAEGVCSGALSRLVSPFEVTALTELGSYSESSATGLRRAVCGAPFAAITGAPSPNRGKVTPITTHPEDAE